MQIIVIKTIITVVVFFLSFLIRVHTKNCNHFLGTFQGPRMANVIIDCTKIHIPSAFEQDFKA